MSPNSGLEFAAQPVHVESLACLCSTHGQRMELDDLDGILESYWETHNRRQDNDWHRHIRECQNARYGNMTSSTVVARDFHDKDLQLPLVESHYTFEEMGPFYDKKTVFIHYSVVSNPLKTLSVLEPLQEGGCKVDSGDTATVARSAQQMQCLVAINAGLFNTTSGACHGNVVSNGRLVQDSGGIQNAHFGIKANGELFFGYLSEIDLVADDFLQLVGGVIWLVRNGKNYVEESLKLECKDTQETGSLVTFTSIVSARTAVGVDAQGRVVLLQVEGKSYQRGVSLEEFAELLLTYDIVDAINLDGGGSATYVINSTVVNYPSDTCADDHRLHCPRHVSTILCVHEPECEPTDCSGHGRCRMGVCECEAPWTGTACDTYHCLNSCSYRGNCSPDGCVCEASWHGDDCSQPCLPGYYGIGCVHECVCLYGASCSPVDGSCDCTPGHTGKACNHDCPFGYYGNNCEHVCLCEDGCPCHSVTGSCNFTDLEQELSRAGQCFAKAMIKEQKLVSDQSEDYRLMQTGFVLLGVVASISAVINILLLYRLHTHTNKSKRTTKYNAPRSTNSSHTFLFQGVSSSDGDLSSLSEYSRAETSFSNSNGFKHLESNDEILSDDNR